MKRSLYRNRNKKIKFGLRKMFSRIFSRKKMDNSHKKIEDIEIGLPNKLIKRESFSQRFFNRLRGRPQIEYNLRPDGYNEGIARKIICNGRNYKDCDFIPAGPYAKM